MTTTTGQRREDSDYHSLTPPPVLPTLSVNGHSMGLKARPATAADHAMANRAITAGNPLCGSAKSVIRRVYAPRASNVTPAGGPRGSGVIDTGSASGRVSASKHVTVERFRVRSVAGVRGIIDGRGRSKRWSRASVPIQSGFSEREVLKIPFITFPRFEESCLRRKNPRLCQQNHPNGSANNRTGFSSSASLSSSSSSSAAVPPRASRSDQAPLKGELIPEKYHPLRDAKTYAELRRILDRNGKYLRRAGNIDSIGQGQRNSCWQQNRTLTRDYDGANSTCSSSSSGGTTIAGAATVQQRVRSRGRQLSQEQCDDTALSYVGQCTQDGRVFERDDGRLKPFRKYANRYYNEGIQWHLEYLDACTQRAEEVKRRFVEKKFFSNNRRESFRQSSSVFKVQESSTEVFDQLVSDRFSRRKPIFRSSIMDSYPSQLCHEKAEKLQILIDNLHQLKLEAAELENEALPKIILTDCSSSPLKNCENCARDESKSVQNNNPRPISQDDPLKPSVRSTNDNHLNISNNNGCYLQPHFNDLKVNNSLSIPTNKLYQSEARPP